MGKRTLIYSVVPVLVLGLAGCTKQGEQKSEQQQQEQPAQQAQQAQPPAEQAQPPAERPGAPASSRREQALKQRPPEQRAAEAQGEKKLARAEQAKAIEIPAGAQLQVRLNQALDTNQNAVGDTFTATLQQPVVVDNRTAIPRGTTFHGKVTTSEASGRLAGTGTLTVKLESFELNGKTYPINSTTVSQTTNSHKKRNIGIIGGTSAIGAAIGAIAGGGKGAAIGAGAGAAAGTAGAAATGKAQVRIPAETVMLFTLQNPVTI